MSHELRGVDNTSDFGSAAAPMEIFGNMCIVVTVCTLQVPRQEIFVPLLFLMRDERFATAGATGLSLARGEGRGRASGAADVTDLGLLANYVTGQGEVSSRPAPPLAAMPRTNRKRWELNPQPPRPTV